MPNGTSPPSNRNPAIEKMMAILAEIERQPNGLPLGKVAEAASVTRSTAYRILNSLVAHGMLRQLENAHFVLGSRLLSLADSVTLGASGARVAAAAQPVIDRISKGLGETAKVTVYDRGVVLVVAISLGRKTRALQAQTGEQLPVHAGAGSKVLLANLPAEELSFLLQRKLPRYTRRTLTDPDRLRAELDLVRAQGWSHDPGEFDLAVQAFAAPIRSRQGDVVAAISLPYFADVSKDYEKSILETACRAAKDIGAAL